MRFRSLAALAVATTLAGTAACTDNSGPNSRITGGTYALTTVNGNQLPYTYNTSSSTVTIQSDVFTLNGNGTYNEVINETISNGFGSSPTTDNEIGTWTQNGSTITFMPTQSTYNTQLAQYQGVLSSGGLFGNNSLVFNTASGDQMVYQQE